MRATQAILDNPIAGYVVLLFVVIFGGVSLSRLPVQLAPEVPETEIGVTTNRRVATPEKVGALKVGNKVVVRGGERLRDAAVVRPVPPAEDSGSG